MYVLTRKQYRRVLKLMLTCRCKERIDQVKPLINHRSEKMSTKIFYWLWPSNHIYRELVIMRCARWRLISDVCLLCERFVFRTEASAKCEWLVTKRKGPWESETRLIRSLLPAFLHAQAFIERERDAWVQGRVGVVLNCTMGLGCVYGIFDLVSCATTQWPIKPQSFPWSSFKPLESRSIC